jgi:hypothetical protein
MTVPKTSAHFDHGIPFRKHDIGGAGQVLPMDPKPKAESMKCPPKLKLRLGMFATNAGHHR